MVFGMLGSASATPVIFDVDGSPDSEVAIKEIDPQDSASFSVALAEGLADVNFTLDDNQSETIDFFTLTATGTGVSFFDIDANLNFDSPELNVNGDGNGLSLVSTNFFGSFSATGFFWEEAVQEFILTDGNIIKIALDDGFQLSCTAVTTVHATITNLGGGGAGAPVPEPSTTILMGLGLLGLVGYGRKKLIKKS